MLLNKFILFTFLLITSGLFAQEKDTLAQDSIKGNQLVQKDSFFKDTLIVDYSLIENGIPEEAIDLGEVLVLGDFKFENPKERRRYLILQRKTRKVWPYATLASERLLELNKRLTKIEDKSDKRDYIRMIQEYLEDEFKEELKNLTKTEGQILVKLLYRQTGTTTYELVREMRSGWNAFWYNTTASFFNISLKKKYLPETVEEDFLIEDILQRSFRKKVLERQKPAIEIDYLHLLEKWNTKDK